MRSAVNKELTTKHLLCPKLAANKEQGLEFRCI